MKVTKFNGPEVYEKMDVRIINPDHAQLRRQIPIEHNGVFVNFPLGDDGVLHINEQQLKRLESLG